MLNLFLMASAKSWRDWAEMLAQRLKLEQSASSAQNEKAGAGAGRYSQAMKNAYR
jgi:hypothetical protein